MNTTTGLGSLRVWHDAMAFSKSIFVQVSGIQNFVVRDQLLRCLISIPSNIAEGYGRYSKKEFSRFLKISLGSCYELITQFELIRDSNLSNGIDIDKVIKQAKQLCSSIVALINYKDERYKQ
jgi:four helix bundle protein